LPDEIRGFGHVKERNLHAVEKKRQTLLTEYAQAAQANRPKTPQEVRQVV
jgi:indolepyruvate ferredoxin oxidoreductase